MMLPVHYGPRPAQVLDLYSPGPRAPVLLWVHGGGWHSGGRGEVSRDLVGRLNAHGFAVASVGFRQLPEAHVEASLADLRLALKSLRPRRVAVMGGSSGGHLALLLGLSSPGVVCIVDKCGAADLTLPASRMSVVQLVTITRAFGHLPGPALRALSPLQQVRPGAPPTLIFHGVQDELVPVSQSRALAGRLRACRDRVELIEVQHAGHEFGPAGGRPSWSTAQINAHIADFLIRAFGRSIATRTAGRQRSAAGRRPGHRFRSGRKSRA